MTQPLLDFIKNHPQLVVAQDFELACQKTQVQRIHYQSGIAGIRSFEESWWVQLKVLHRNRPGVAVACALTEQTLDKLVSDALLNAEQSTPDPWFRFPVWSPRKEEVPVERIGRAPEDFWISCFSKLEKPSLDFQEWYEWWDLETILFRRSERAQKQSRVSTGLQRWSLGRCHEEFWGLEDRGQRIRKLLRAVESLEESAKKVVEPLEIFSLSGRAMAPLLKQLSHWFCANNRKNKKSPLYPCDPDSKVLSPFLNLSDDGEKIPSPFSASFDLDGIPSQKTILVQAGSLKSFLYDSYFGAVDNCRSTGNKVRDLEDLEPQLRAKGICLEPGKNSPNLFWKEKLRGVSLEGWLALRFISESEFEGDAFGWRMENGLPAEPIRIRVPKTNLIHLMRQVLEVGNDPERHGLSLSPTVFFKGAP